MRFAHDEDSRLLAGALRAFLEKECPPARVRALGASETGRSRELWGALAELGLAGLLAPEAAGGMGRDEIDMALLCEEAGRAALAEPVVETALVALPLVRDAGDPALRERWLAPLATGRALAAVAHPVSPFASDAHVADLLLAAHGEDELHALERGRFELVAQSANDPGRRLASVRFAPSAATRIAAGERARELLAAALDRGALGTAAELAGVAARLVELAVGHARQREQFERPIGSFQALQHLLADAWVALEYARPVVQRAAHSVARGDPGRAVHVSHAKLAAGRAAALAAGVALQVHGAIGYTWEHDLHLWLRRAWSLALAWGDEAYHRARVAEAVLEGGFPIGPGATFRGGD